MNREKFFTRWPSLRVPSFRRLIFIRFFVTLAINAQSLGVIWQIFDLTHDPVIVGMTGLVQIVPIVLMAVISGEVADRYRREMVLAVMAAVLGVCAVMLLVLTWLDVRDVVFYFAVMLVVGFCRAFLNPALQALMPSLVDREHVGNAVALNALGSRIAQALGPITSGALLVFTPMLVHATNTVAFATGLIAALQIVRMNKVVQVRTTGKVSLETLFAGFRYMGTNKALLGAITLDTAAVLFSGVNSLLPFFAEDILHVGPAGLGFLRGSAAIGGLAGAIYVGARPIRTPAGRTLFATIACFGAMTIVFALSTWPWLSVAALMTVGFCDMVSFYIRWTLIQSWTPDELRGRVSAVASINGTTATELGDTRAGLTAGLLGVIPAVIVGGLCTIGLVVIWTRVFPQLVRVRSFTPPPA
jgi:MFS family permease